MISLNKFYNINTIKKRKSLIMNLIVTEFYFCAKKKKITCNFSLIIKWIHFLRYYNRNIFWFMFSNYNINLNKLNASLKKNYMWHFLISINGLLIHITTNEIFTQFSSLNSEFNHKITKNDLKFVQYCRLFQEKINCVFVVKIFKFYVKTLKTGIELMPKINVITENSKKKNDISLNYNLIGFFFFELLISLKYIQFFYIFNIIIKLNFVGFYFLSCDFILKLILKLKNSLEFNNFFIQSGSLKHLSSMLQQKKKFSKKFKYIDLTTKNLKNCFIKNNNYNNYNNFIKFYNVLKNVSLDESELLKYVKIYLRYFCEQDYRVLSMNNNLVTMSFFFNNKKYSIFSYLFLKNSFFSFVKLLVKSAILNSFPILMCPSFLENDTSILYSYLFYTQKKIFCESKVLKKIVFYNNLKYFSKIFNIPSFFFILDIKKLIVCLQIVKKYSVPVSGLCPRNVNINIFDFPIIVSNISNKSIFLFYSIIIRLIFIGLTKKKKIFWNFFIKQLIIYYLKKIYFMKQLNY